MHRKEKVLFLVAPGRRHLLVELEEPYNRKELAVLLAAFRRRLTDDDDDAGNGRTASEPVDRIVGPGFVIDLLGKQRRR